LFIDNDGDGYTAGTATVCYGSSIPPGYATTSKGTDCNDKDATIHDTPIAGTISGGASVCPGTNSTMLTLTGSAGTIQWQSSLKNITFNNIGGATTKTYTGINLSVTTYSRVVVSSGTCPTATSASVAISMGSLQNATSLTTTGITSTSATLNWVSSYNP